MNVKNNIIRPVLFCLVVLLSCTSVCRLNAQEVANSVNGKTNIQNIKKDIRKNGMMPKTPVKPVLLQDTVVNLNDSLLMATEVL